MNIIDKITNKFNLSPAKQKVIRNVVWAVIGKVTTLLGSLLVGVFVARYLGPEQYGLMNYVISYVTIFQVIAYFGMDNIEIREESKIPEQKDKIIGTAFTLKIGFALLTMLIVAITVWIFEADSFTKWMIILYSASMIANSFNVIRNYFTSLVWNEYIVKTEITRTFVGAGIKIALLLFHAPLVWFIVATLFDTILIAGGYLVSYRSKIDSIWKWTFDKEQAKYILKQSFPLLLSGAAVIIYQKIDQVMISNMIDNAAVGYYSVAGKFLEICIFVPTILTQTITPILVKAREQNENEYKEKAQVFMNITVWGTIIMCLLVSLLATPLIQYTFGAQYMASVVLLQIMVFKVIGYAHAQITGAMIIVENKQKYVVVRNLIGCICAIGFNLFMIPSFGAVGAAISSIITAACTGIFSHLIIPSYRPFFRMQIYSFVYGWKDLTRICTLKKKHNYA